MIQGPSEDDQDPSFDLEQDRLAVPSDYIVLVARSMFLRVLTFARSILVLPLLSPALFGQYRFVAAVAAYLNHLHFGTLDLVIIKYPKLTAAGQDLKASELLAKTFQVCLVGSLVGSVIMFILAASAAVSGIVLITVVSVIVFFQLLHHFISVRLRVTFAFTRMAWLDMRAGLVCLLLVIVATWIGGYEGLLMTGFLTSPLVVMAGRKNLFPEGWSRLRARSLLETITAGGRVLTTGLSNELASTLDLVLLTFILADDRTAVGLYAFAGVLGFLVTGFANAFAQVEFVRISNRAGTVSSVSDPEMINHLERAIARDGLIAAVIATTLSVLAAVLVPFVLVAYVPALLILGPMVVAAVPRRWRKYAGLFAALNDRARWTNLAAGASSLVTIAGFLAVHTRFKDSLAGYSIVTLLSELIPSTLLVTASFGPQAKSRNIRNPVWRILATNCPLAILVTIPFVITGPVGLATAAIGALILLLVLHAALYPSALSESMELVKAGLADLRRGTRLLQRGLGRDARR